MEGEQRGQDDAGTSSRDPVQVEPKTYFANERTFIQWISAALLLLTVSSIMMGSGNYNGTSSVIAFSSLILVLYAAFVYFRRVNLLRSGAAYGYLDIFGPTILAVGVGVGVFVVFADAIKGSEFLPFGKMGEGKDDRRFLKSPSLASPLSFSEHGPVYEYYQDHPIGPSLLETEGSCMQHSMQGVNLLEYQPRDILLNNNDGSFIVATPQTLVAHPFRTASTMEASIVSEIANVELQSTMMVGDRLFALSTGPSQTELLEFDRHHGEIQSRVVLQDHPSTVGSMVYIPSSSKILLYLDGAMHSYQLLAGNSGNESKELSLSRTGSINMKVLNRGTTSTTSTSATKENAITAMEHFEGVTFILRGHQNILQAWDLSTPSPSLLTEFSLPAVPNHRNDDQWVGMALERRRMEEETTSNLRNGSSSSSSMSSSSSTVWLHMPLDTFPPQLWSFRLDEQVIRLDGNNNDSKQPSMFSLPECNGN
jgi:uncharacterized membrane protein YidH (DUF202 family)